MIEDTAVRKQRAATARREHANSIKDSPKDVYLSACARIAEAFVPDGYRFAKSGPHLTRKAGPFAFTVSFQSSRHNIAGQHVALWIHANVKSPVLKKWRVTNQAVGRVDDFTAGGQIGNLIANHSWMEWELANRDEREMQIADAVETIRKIVIPYFELFEQTTQLCDHLQDHDLPGMDIWGAFDFVACFSSLPAARRTAVRFLERHTALVREYREEVEQIRKNRQLQVGWRGSYAKFLAAASIHFELGDFSDPELA